MLVSFVVAAVFLYLAFRTTNFRELWDSLKKVDYAWVTLLIPVGLLSHYVRALRWGYLLRPVKRHIAARNLFSAVMIGYLVNNVIPRAGELVRSYGLGKTESIPTTTVLGTVVVERILDLLVFSLILCVVVVISPSVLAPFVEDVDAIRPIFLVGSVISLGVFVLLFFRGEALFRLVKILEPLVPTRLRERFRQHVGSFLSGFGVSKMSETFVSIFVLSSIMWFLYIFSLYLGFYAFPDLSTHTLGFEAATILLTASTIAFIFPAPGAMGTYHSFLTMVLVQLYHVESATALSYSIITHELGYFLTTVVGLYFLLKDQLKISDAERAAERAVQS